MKKFSLYIGIVIGVFNLFVLSWSGFADELKNETTKDFEYRDSYEVRVLENKIQEKKKGRFRKENNIFYLVTVPLAADKYYAGDAIDGDLDDLLYLLSGRSEDDSKDARLYAEYIRLFVKTKRWYTKVVHALEQRVMALKLLPKDALVVAKEEEVLEFEGGEGTPSPEGEYRVSYTPYKYVDYDTSEEGRPALRRDKNYIEPVFHVEEFVLALFKFDVPGMIAALQKSSHSNDGSAEAMVPFADGIEGRMLFNEIFPGDDPLVTGVFEIAVPHGYYLNGDFMNEGFRPRFVLTEDGKRDNNIKSFELLQPVSTEILTPDGKKIRVFADRVLLPFRLERKDVYKNTHIKGNLSFVYCDYQHNCQQTTGNHEFKLKSSVNRAYSVYSNYIREGFLMVPDEKSDYAEIRDVMFNEETQQFRVVFDISRKFSKMAVMAEDKANTMFLNASYEFIGNNKAVANFDVATVNGDRVTELKEVAISAAFNGSELLRKVVYPKALQGEEGEFLAGLDDENSQDDVIYIEDYEKQISKQGNLILFWFGVLFYITFGGLYIAVKLLKEIWTKKNPIKIVLRYGGIVAFGLSCFIYFGNNGYGYFWPYYSLWVLVATFYLLISFAAESLKLTNFSVFRPFKQYIKKGWFLGCETVLLLMVMPIFYKNESLSFLINLPKESAVLKGLFVFLGLMCLPILALIFRFKNTAWLEGFSRFNGYYSLTGALFVWWLFLLRFGIIAGICFILFGGIVFVLWNRFIFVLYHAVSRLKKEERIKERLSVVQKRFVVYFVALYFGFVSLGNLFEPHIYQNPSNQQILEFIEKGKEGDKPVLICADADFSLLSLFNRFYINKLVRAGVVDVLTVKLTDEVIDFPNSLKKFADKGFPFYILYSKRYKNGVLILRKLNDIDFYKLLDINVLRMRGKLNE